MNQIQCTAILSAIRIFNKIVIQAPMLDAVDEEMFGFSRVQYVLH